MRKLGNQQRVSSVSSRTLANQRGQAIVELGMIIVFFVALLFGVIEFGRTWYIVNMITHGARDGARIAATIPSTNRSGGTISPADIGNIQTYVANFINTSMAVAVQGAAYNSSPITASNVSIVQSTDGMGNPIVTVTVTGSVPFAFNSLFGSGFAFNRTVTFRDEGS